MKSSFFPPPFSTAKGKKTTNFGKTLAQGYQQADSVPSDVQYQNWRDRIDCSAGVCTSQRLSAPERDV